MCHDRSNPAPRPKTPKKALGPAGAILTMILVVGVGVFLFSNHHRPSPMIMMSVAVCVSLCITPYSWAYDQMLLIISLASIMICMMQLGFRYILIALIPIMISSLSLGLIFIATIYGNDAMSVLVPLTCLSLLLWLYSKTKVGLTKKEL